MNINRDLIAIECLKGFLSRSTGDGEYMPIRERYGFNRYIRAEEFVETSYIIADAVLKIRDKINES